MIVELILGSAFILFILLIVILANRDAKKGGFNEK